MDALTAIALLAALSAVLILSVRGFGMGWRRRPRADQTGTLQGSGSGSAPAPGLETRRLVALRGGLASSPSFRTRRVRAHIEVLRSTTAGLPALRRPGLHAHGDIDARSKRLSVVR